MDSGYEVEILLLNPASALLLGRTIRDREWVLLIGGWFCTSSAYMYSSVTHNM